MNRFKVALDELVAQTAAKIDAFRVFGNLSIEPRSHFGDIRELIMSTQKSPETLKIVAKCVSS